MNIQSLNDPISISKKGLCMYPDVAGSILAGGKSKRMGGINKSLIKIEGVPIIQRTIGILKELFEEVILVTNLPQDYGQYRKEVSIVTDSIKDVGPLGGIFTALSETSKEAVFFVACDMPFLHNGLIRQQIDCFKRQNCDCCVPRIKGFIQPLHSVYKREVKDIIIPFLKRNTHYSIRELLKELNVYYWDLKDNQSLRKIFRNLNTQEDVVHSNINF